MQIALNAITDRAGLSSGSFTGFFISIYQMPFPMWILYYSHFSAAMTEHGVKLNGWSPSPCGPHGRTDRRDIHFCVGGNEHPSFHLQFSPRFFVCLLIPNNSFYMTFTLSQRVRYSPVPSSPGRLWRFAMNTKIEFRLGDTEK